MIGVPFVGEFRELEYGNPDSPSIRAAVRAAAAAHEDDPVRYLRAGALVAAIPALVPDVLSETGGLIAGLRVLTDGHRLWFSDPAHYAGRYHVELDPEFVEHARRNGWTVPQVGAEHLDEMTTLLAGDEDEPE